jgi:hypothetical protein
MLTGFMMGAIFLLISLLICIIKIGNVSIENNKIFRDNFPVWRGASYLLLYLWILGFSVLFYEKSQINYRLIFHY